MVGVQRLADVDLDAVGVWGDRVSSYRKDIRLIDSGMLPPTRREPPYTNQPRLDEFRVTGKQSVTPQVR